MKALRRAAAAVVVIFAAAALYHVAWLPYQCNRLRKPLRAEMEAVFGVSSRIDSHRAKVIARHDSAAAMACASRCPTNPDFLMIAAAGQRIIGRPEVAAELYERALRLDRRPEIYLGLGTSLLEIGRREAATEAFMTGGMFAPYTIDMIVDPSIRQQVRNAVEERDRRLLESGKPAGQQ